MKPRTLTSKAKNLVLDAWKEIEQLLDEAELPRQEAALLAVKEVLMYLDDAISDPSVSFMWTAPKFYSILKVALDVAPNYMGRKVESAIEPLVNFLENFHARNLDNSRTSEVMSSLKRPYTLSDLTLIMLAYEEDLREIKSS